MNKKLLRSVREYKKQSVLAPILVILEVLMEVLIPLEMAKIIDVGIANGDMSYIIQRGVILVAMAMLSLFFGVQAGNMAAVAAAGIVRTKDLKHWERLDNLKTLHSPQQRNVVLHPEFIHGKYAFYTRPMDDFIDTGSGGGIGFGLCEDIEHAVIDEEIITSKRKYHTITEAKNGAGAVPIKTDRGWIHIAHGVRNTAAGLRYVIYAFATALDDPSRITACASSPSITALAFGTGCCTDLRY